jgi:DNA repair protein RecO (recombination protein O)
MEERTTGVILRTRPLTETSLIVQWLTAHFGRVSTVAKGAKRPRSPYAGKLDLFYIAEFTFSRSRRSDLHQLREVQVRAFHPDLRREVRCLQQACYFVQLIEQCTEADTPMPGMFELLSEALAVLPQAPAPELIVFAFEMKLLEALGLQPDLDHSKLSPGVRQVLSFLTTASWPSVLQLRVSQKQQAEMEPFLNGVLAFEFDRVPGTRRLALQAQPVAGSAIANCKV